MGVILLIIAGMIVIFLIVLLISSQKTKQRKVSKKDKDIELSLEKPIPIKDFDRYITAGLADAELLNLIKAAKKEGKVEVMYTQAKYNNMHRVLLYKESEKEKALSINKEPDLVKCPKCKSTQIAADKTGYSLGKGLAGAFLTGGIGLIAGFHGANNLQVHCIKCGHKWKAGKQ